MTRLASQITASGSASSSALRTASSPPSAPAERPAPARRSRQSCTTATSTAFVYSRYHVWPLASFTSGTTYAARRWASPSAGFASGRRSPPSLPIRLSTPASSLARRDGCTLASNRVRFEHVLVVGAGQMGAGIAQVVAASGRRVSLHDVVPGAVDRGLAGMRRSLDRLAAKGGPAADGVLARVTPVDNLVAADLLIEAATEDRRVKEDLFRRADE